MKRLTQLEEALYNNGERLIPGVTHDIFELIRHRSTYVFFKKIIELDLASGRVLAPVRVVDVGCGVGHGCYTLSEIPDTQILGVDISPGAIEYAKNHYANPNIAYQCADLQEFINTMPEFDYIVSRHAFEHIPNGIDLALSMKCNGRLMFEVPYDEPEGNPHHVSLGIREGSFARFPEAALFFQDLEGKIYDLSSKPVKPNGIICISGYLGSPGVIESMLSSPLPPWQPEDREYRHLVQQYLDKHREHQALRQQYQALQQTRAVTIARKLEEHPFLMKLASVGYSFMAKMYLVFRRSKDDI
jgi:SAM-dependent methyltransferase